MWFATDTAGRLLSLDPRTDTVRERGTLPGRALALGFGSDGTCHVVGYADREDKLRVATYRVDDDRLKPLDTIPGRGRCPATRLCRSGASCPTATAATMSASSRKDGERAGRPWRSRSVYADGRMKSLLDFGELYAMRRTFGPWECVYSLQFDAQHNIIFTALPLQAVYQVAGDGKILWEAGAQPQGGADAIACWPPAANGHRQPRADWVVDSETDKIYCLSPQGKLLSGVRRCKQDQPSTRRRHGRIATSSSPA